jgi:hypothetical protein
MWFSCKKQQETGYILHNLLTTLTDYEENKEFKYVLLYATVQKPEPTLPSLHTCRLLTFYVLLFRNHVIITQWFHNIKLKKKYGYYKRKKNSPRQTRSE